MGDSISIGQSLYVTIFSMAIVFATLLIISFVLTGFKYVFKKDNKKKVITSNKKSANINNTSATRQVVIEESQDEELVAVITAALAASLSKPISQIKISTIKRVYQSSSHWVMSGRQDSYANWQANKMKN